MAHADAPPFPGEWISQELANTGRWTLGRVWIDRAQSRYCLKVGPQHSNAFGMMHGGALATFVDAQVVAVRPYTGDEADHTPTVSLSIDYIAPVPDGSWLVLEAEVLRTTRTLIFTQAKVTIGDRIVARTHAIYRNHPTAGASQ